MDPDQMPSTAVFSKNDKSWVSRTRVKTTAQINDKNNMHMNLLNIYIYSKTGVKRPLEKRQNKDLNDKW